MEFNFVSVYALSPGKNTDIEVDKISGGQLSIDNEARRIFGPSFNAILPKSLKVQPFHFFFEGNKRKNDTRDGLIKFFNYTDLAEMELISREFAFRLAKAIDNRTRDLLFTFAAGSKGDIQRIALLAFPHDEPIQYQSNQGIPDIAEIKNAFSKSSHLRKAAYFEIEREKIGRNELLKGLLVDSSAGRAHSAANYWLADFLEGTMEVLPIRGTNQIIKGIRAAQKHAKSPEERNSAKAAFYSILSGSKKDATINEIGNLLVGKAKTEYFRAMPKSIENNARFLIDIDEAKRRIKSIIFILKNGIEIHFPNDIEIDADDYITIKDGRRTMSVSDEIDEEVFR